MQVKTKNIMVAGLAVVLVLLLWYRMVYSPMESQASKAHAATTNAQDRENTLRASLNDTNPTKKKKPGQPSAADLDATLPPNPSESEFLRNVNAVVASSGVAWQSITPGTPTTTGGLSAMTVGITAGGTYDQLNRYLQGLLAMKRLFVIDTVSYTSAGATNGGSGSSGSSGNGNGLTLLVNGRVFSQALAASAATGTIGSSPGGTTAPAAKTPAAGAQPAGVQNG